MWYATHFAHLQCLIFGCYILKTRSGWGGMADLWWRNGSVGIWPVGGWPSQVAQPTTSQNDGMGESRGGEGVVRRHLAL